MDLTKTLFSGPDSPQEDDMYKCVHCGFCLQACPTYLETGLETESPRGRITLMKAVNEGRIGITPTVVNHWDLCIQCRACEVACPSGVPYGRLIESTLAQVELHRKTRLITRTIKWILLKLILPKQHRLRLIVNAFRLYQQSGIQNLVRKTGLLNKLSISLSELERSTPRIHGKEFRANGQLISSYGNTKARVALFSGCVMPLIDGPQMDAVSRVLSRNGCEVVVSKGQTCCGAIHSHSGDLETARTLARKNIDVFLESGADAIVIASAGCGIRMKEYGELLQKDNNYSVKAEQLSKRVKDIHEFLVQLPYTPPQSGLPYRVTYQGSCHLSHAQRITDAPRDILSSIPDLQLIEMEGAANCCGAGGSYSITQREFSMKLLDTKMCSINKTGANLIATANPGCAIQLRLGIQLGPSNARVRYVTDLLDLAYSLE